MLLYGARMSTCFSFSVVECYWLILCSEGQAWAGLSDRSALITIWLWNESPIAWVWFSAVSEAEKSESVKAGHLIKAHCEISDGALQTCRYEDGIELLQEVNLKVESEPDKGALVTQSSPSSYSRVYECKADDDVKDFKVKGDKLIFFLAIYLYSSVVNTLMAFNISKSKSQSSSYTL